MKMVEVLPGQLLFVERMSLSFLEGSELVFYFKLRGKGRKRNKWDRMFTPMSFISEGVASTESFLNFDSTGIRFH